MIFIIEFGNKCVIRILDKATILTLSKQLAKCFQLRYVILKESETSSHNFAGGAVSAAVKLGCNEIIKMCAKSDAGVLAHFVIQNDVPIIGIFWYKTYNKSIAQADIRYLQHNIKIIFATEIHGRKDENKILMATESTEEHGKIKSIHKSIMSDNK